MSVQDIIAKIMTQAEAEAATIKSAAEKEAKQLSSDLAKQGEEERATLGASTEEKIEKAAARAESLANMEGRNQVLQKKRDILEAVLAEVIQKLSSIPAKEYEQLLAELMKGIDLNEGTVYPAKGKENSTKGAIKIAGKGFKVGESKDFSGGFVLESGVSDVDMRFETLVLNNYRKDLEAKISTELF